jgi:hypothetical protein
MMPPPDPPNSKFFTPLAPPEPSYKVELMLV